MLSFTVLEKKNAFSLTFASLFILITDNKPKAIFLTDCQNRPTDNTVTELAKGVLSLGNGNHRHYGW